MSCVRRAKEASSCESKHGGRSLDKHLLLVVLVLQNKVEKETVATDSLLTGMNELKQSDVQWSKIRVMAM